MMMMMMYSVALLLAGACSVQGFSGSLGNVQKFQLETTSRLAMRRSLFELDTTSRLDTRRTSLFSSLNSEEALSKESIQHHHTPSSPAVVFGKPLDDDEKKRNKQLIGAAKSALFDVLLPGKTVDRAYARFYALETIARMPYFSYLSVLHLYETLGWWRRADYIKMHFAESWNELHHLLIMEELGGSDRWFDRFIAQHAAFFYYWVVVAAYMANPSFAYNLNQAVEEHAFDTYTKFIDANGDYLKTLSAPDIAKDYYRDGDLYMFDEMHATKEKTQVRRPKCDTLYDVFCNIRDDELEHVKTMAFLQEDDADLQGANVKRVNGLAVNMTETVIINEAAA